MSESVTYVYAVTRGMAESTPAGLEGVGGAPVRILGQGDLQGVVSDVDRADFEARALEERLEDLEWLAVTAQAHHRVVDTVGRDHVVAPLSLATVYYGDERVREVLAAGESVFRRVLDRLADRSEWGVKAYARDGVPAERAARPASGAEYLRRRRQELREGDRSLEAAQQAAERIHDQLAELAVSTRHHRLQDAALSGSSERMVLNGAYLVPTAAQDELATLVRSLADHPRLRVELTGPWVPYSFARIDET